MFTSAAEEDTEAFAKAVPRTVNIFNLRDPGALTVCIALPAYTGRVKVVALSEEEWDTVRTSDTAGMSMTPDRRGIRFLDAEECDETRCVYSALVRISFRSGVIFSARLLAYMSDVEWMTPEMPSSLD